MKENYPDYFAKYYDRIDHRFQLIIAPFRTFMHILAIEDQLSALQNIFDLLEAGGKFIFDAFVPNLNILQNGIDRQSDFEEEVEPGLILRRITSSKSNLISQLTHVIFTFEFDDGKQIISKTWETDLRLFFRWELELLISKSPFNKWKIIGDFSGNPLSPSSTDFIVICHK